jgi:hypothetical protein
LFSLSDTLSQAHWPDKVTKVQNSINRVCSLYLSAFGRTFTVSSYALAWLIFCMEFSAPSSLTFLSPVISRTRKLMDHGNFNCNITGLPQRTLLGTPREGGFGLLPSLQHCCSRHVFLLTRTLKLSGTLDPPPYVLLISDLLALNSPPYSFLALLTMRRSNIAARAKRTTRREVNLLLNNTSPVHKN